MAGSNQVVCVALYASWWYIWLVSLPPLYFLIASYPGFPQTHNSTQNCVFAESLGMRPGYKANFLTHACLLSQVSEFKDQLLATAHVKPERIMEFSCGMEKMSVPREFQVLHHPTRRLSSNLCMVGNFHGGKNSRIGQKWPQFIFVVLFLQFRPLCACICIHT